MDKYKQKNGFREWVSPINLKQLSAEAKSAIDNFNLYTKKLSFQQALKLLLYSINSELDSLRHMSTELYLPELQRELELDSISYSQLSRTLNKIPTNILWEIFYQLLQLVQQKDSRDNRHKAFLIDSTTLSFGIRRFPWAIFRSTKAGIKVHMKLCYVDDGDVYPEDFTLSVAKEPDSNYLDCFLTNQLATYIFDRGYLDFNRLDRMQRDGYFFVTRLKKNTLIIDAQENMWPEDNQSPITQDVLARLGGTKETKSYFRIITIKCPGRSDLRLVTNRMDLTAEEISEMYQSRWQIELFFKHIKQNLKIKHLYAQSEQGVENQIVLAMISYLLNYLIKLKTSSRRSLFDIIRILKTLWFKPLEYILNILEPG